VTDPTPGSGSSSESVPRSSALRRKLLMTR